MNTYSPRVCMACALFGLRPDALPEPVPEPAQTARLIDEMLLPGQIALLTRPSGSGKSTILRRLVERLESRWVPVVSAERCMEDRCVPDLFDLPLVETLGILAAAGLAEAPILVRKPLELSDGQQARLGLALGLARAARERVLEPTTIIFDEFVSTLDRITAASVSTALGRFTARNLDIRVVCAAANDDILESLCPEILVHQPLGRAAAIITRGQL